MELVSAKTKNNRRSNKRPILPLCLLVDGRPCLVVGGGKVAHRKVDALLAAGAEVTVVSPEVNEVIRQYAAAGRITLVQSEFTPDVIAGAFVVYAATNHVDVNRTVLQQCRQQNVFCGIVDKGWQHGDFISPATIQAGGLTVAVSTGGKSCRRSRLVKESLGRHLGFVDTSDLLVIGTDHRFLNLPRREPLHLTGDRYERTGRLLQNLAALHEFVLLNTCNRIELLGFGSQDDSLIESATLMLGFAGLPEHEQYVLRGFDAFRHLAKTAAGLHSQAPGEKHIVAQIKSALSAAAENGWSGALMHDWFGRALAVSREIRNATEAQLPAGDVEDICVALLEDRLGSLRDKRILIVGGGEVATVLIHKLLHRGSDTTCCFRRNKPLVQDESEGRIRYRPMEELAPCIAANPVVICATSSDRYVVTASDLPECDYDTPRLLVDLGVPRNIDPALSEMTSVDALLDLESLREWQAYKNPDLVRVHTQADTIVRNNRTSYDQIVEQFNDRHTQ